MKKMGNDTIPIALMIILVLAYIFVVVWAMHKAYNNYNELKEQRGSNVRQDIAERCCSIIRECVTDNSEQNAACSQIWTMSREESE